MSDIGGAKSPSTFAKQYGLGRSTVCGEIGAGRLKAFKVGSRTLIFDADEQEWRENLPRLKATKNLED